MQKITQEQIKFIDNYLQKSDVIFVDIRDELTDHIASAVEEKMDAENLDFMMLLKILWCVIKNSFCEKGIAFCHHFSVLVKHFINGIIRSLEF